MGQVTGPVLSVELGDQVPLLDWELGTDLKLRWRHLVLDGFVRSKEEAIRLGDSLSVWLDENVSIDVQDHDATTLAVVGPVRVADGRLNRAEWLDDAEEKRFEVLLTSRLEYVS